MRRRQHYASQFAPPIRSRRQREDDAVERDIQSAARNARYIEARERAAAAANEPAPAQEQQKPQGEKKHD